MVIDNTTEESLQYLLCHLDSFIEEEAYRVLSDSDEDPQCSAVTLCNLITNYLCAMKAFSQELVPSDITSYLLERCFTSEEVSILLDKKEKESRYYIGKIF